MGKLKVSKDVGGIKGLCVILPEIFSDSRGYFTETYNKADFEKEGIFIDFVQDNQSKSTKGVLRGLHFQKEYPQCKLVRVISGEVFDVAVDLRKESETFGKWHGEVLSSENRKQFLIPKGFAHGFLVLTDFAEFCYKCDDFYHPNDEGGIAWSDPAIGIQWPLVAKNCQDEYVYEMIDGTKLILSEKDKKWSGINAFVF
ncbi:MAG: dTDP-4-dehydrorhamnose 3,5-epimerase [Oscillospiraceae bacterium]|nr:dTDP-4-dehydrorhamnose 3,5-epimerase [Oscillospiraceae bacterium]